MFGRFLMPTTSWQTGKHLGRDKNFTETSGAGLNQRMRYLMNPPAAKHEHEIADAYERWERNCDTLAKFGAQYQMNAHFKIIAVTSLLCGKMKDEGRVRSAQVHASKGATRRWCRCWSRKGTQEVDWRNQRDAWNRIWRSSSKQDFNEDLLFQQKK